MRRGIPPHPTPRRGLRRILRGANTSFQTLGFGKLKKVAPASKLLAASYGGSRGTGITHFQTPKFGKLKKVAPGVAHILWEDSLGKKFPEVNFLLRRRELDKSIFKHF